MDEIEFSLSPDPTEIIAVQTRGGVVENVHRGSFAVTASDGSLLMAAGDPSGAVYPRSALKPLQVLAMLRHGLRLPDDELVALAVSSHSGSPRHIAGVHRLLQSAGLDASRLQNTPDLPYGTSERIDWIRDGHDAAPVAHVCSGKHAAMLVTSAVNGWSLTDYLDARHPLQLAIRSTIEELTGTSVLASGVDGCRAPTFSVPLQAMARAYGTVAAAEARTPEGRVAAAMRAHPGLVAGEGRDVTIAMRTLPGFLFKDGAAGVQLVGLPDGRGIAVKVADGTDAVRMPVTASVLRRLGVPRAALLNVSQAVQSDPEGHVVAALTAVAGSRTDKKAGGDHGC